MAKRPVPIENSLSEELFNELLNFIESVNQSGKPGNIEIFGNEGLMVRFPDAVAIPTERAFWGWLIQTHRYTLEELPNRKFRYWFGRLVSSGWIGIEPNTRSLIIRRNVKVSIER